MLCVFVRLCARENQMMKVREEVNFSGFIYPFLKKKLKDFSRTFKDRFPIFQGLHSVQKRALSLYFLVLPQHEQFYLEGLSAFTPFCHLRI